jgi:restriction system protein
MARKPSLITILKQADRAAERARKQELARQTKRAKEFERAQKSYLRSIEQQNKADAKEQARLYTESRIAQVELQNEQLEEEIKQFNNLLADTLPVDDYLDWETLKKSIPTISPYHPGQLGVAEPEPSISN